VRPSYDFSQIKTLPAGSSEADGALVVNYVGGRILAKYLG
jgi:hypothetical protein